MRGSITDVNVLIVDTTYVQLGQTVIFKLKYLIQRAVMPLNAVLGLSDNLCDVLRGKPFAKGKVRIAVDMLMDTFNNVDNRDKTRLITNVST
jgi:hypothetical protein